MVISVDPVINMPIHYNTLWTLLQFSMFILSIFNCKGEQSVFGGGERETEYKGQFDPYSKYFQDMIKNISLLLLIRVTGQYLAGGMIQQLQTDV